MKVSQKDLAGLLGVSVRLVREWKAEGLIPDADGEYDLRTAIRWRLNLEAKRFDQKQDIATATARFRLAKARAAEAELALRQGELITVAEVEEILDRPMLATRSLLLALPRKAAPVLAGRETREIEAELTTLVRNCLDEISTIPERLAAKGKSRKRRERPLAASGDTRGHDSAVDRGL